MYDYQFPAVTLETTDKEQVEKIRDEVMEFMVAADIYGCSEDDVKLNPLNVNACIELLDIIHACETMLRLFDRTIVGACSEIVKAKNRARGYYNEVPDFEKAARKITADDYVNGRC